jgi:hypothetical protein
LKICDLKGFVDVMDETTEVVRIGTKQDRVVWDRVNGKEFPHSL